MMPWKLLVFIAVMTIVLVFIGFNLDNRCDLSLVFVTYRSVPVVITMLAAYLLGLLSAFFLALGWRGTSRRKASPKRAQASMHGSGTGSGSALPEHSDVKPAPPMGATTFGATTSGAPDSGALDSGAKRSRKKRA